VTDDAYLRVVCDQCRADYISVPSMRLCPSCWRCCINAEHDHYATATRSQLFDWLAEVENEQAAAGERRPDTRRLRFRSVEEWQAQYAARAGGRPA
jgi:hypothetical protein